MLLDVEDRLLVLHVNCHELVADLRSVLCVVHKAERLFGNLLLDLWVFFEFYAFALNLLAPAVFVEALSEEDDVGQHCPIVLLVDSIAHTVQVKREDLVNLHLLPVLVVQ